MTTNEFSLSVKFDDAKTASKFFSALATALSQVEAKPAEPQAKDDIVVETLSFKATTEPTTGSKTAPTFVNVGAEPKKRRNRKQGQKPDPFKLVKEGYVVRGPYKGNNRQEIWLSRPGKMQHDNIRYHFGEEIKEADLPKLRELASVNEKGVGRSANAVRKKPDPFELLKQGWLVRGPYSHKQSDGSSTSELVIMDPVKKYKEKFTYTIGIRITEADSKKLIELGKANDGKVVDGRINNGAKPLGLRKQAEPVKGCTICFDKNAPVGSCKSLKSVHCATCCDSLKHRVD